MSCITLYGTHQSLFPCLWTLAASRFWLLWTKLLRTSHLLAGYFHLINSGTWKLVCSKLSSPECVSSPWVPVSVSGTTLRSAARLITSGAVLDCPRPWSLSHSQIQSPASTVFVSTHFALCHDHYPVGSCHHFPLGCQNNLLTGLLATSPGSPLLSPNYGQRSLKKYTFDHIIFLLKRLVVSHCS